MKKALFFILIFVVWATLSISVKAEWYDSNYAYCQNVTVTNGKASYPAFINVTYNAHMQSDFDDIRFVNTTCNSTGGALLQHFQRHRSNSNWATFDVLLDGTQNISIYYGNASVTNVSNLTGVWGYGLVGYWTFDEGTGSVVGDISGNNHNGYFNGTFNCVNKMYGCAGNFTGTQVVQIASTNLLNISSQITLEAYINYTAGTWALYSSILAKRLETSARYQFSINADPGNNPRYQEYYDGTTATEANTNSLDLNKQYFIAWDLDSGGKLNFTINSSHYYNATGKGLGTGTGQNVTIGTGYRLGTDGWKGQIDEVRLYNYSLGSQTIDNHYSATPPTFTQQAEQEYPAGPTSTSIALWINNAQANITTACSFTNHNYTAQITPSGLPVSILYNGSHGATNTTTVNWYASLIAGYFNITANYSGNASYSSSIATLWHNITLGNATSNVSIYFNTTPSNNTTSCINTPLNITCGSWALEDGVTLYNNTNNLTNPYYITPTVASNITYTCNWTAGDCYGAGSITKTLSVVDCTPVTPPASLTNYTYTICYTNTTLLKHHAWYDNGTFKYNDTYTLCQYNCDNVSDPALCNPPTYQQNLIGFIIFIVFIIAMYFVLRRL